MLKVSVIVPVYNVERYIEECLDSLARQSLRECEFICVDDGSEDGSYRIIEAYAGRDKRFKLIRQENKGQAEARNVGIRAATGKYIAFLDSDDLLKEKDALDELYGVAEKAQVDFLTYDADCFYESDILRETDNRDSYYIRKREYGVFPTGRELFCEMIKHNDFCDAVWVLFLRRDWILSNNLWFPVGLNPEDCIWCFLCYMCAGRVKHVQKSYYKYRIRNNSLTTKKISFDDIYGRIYTVREILRFALMNTLSVSEERAICKFVDIILWHIKNKYLKLEISEAYRIRELSPLDRLLVSYMNYPLFNDSKFNFLIYMRGFKNVLQESSGIIIYGAGKMGKLVRRYMEKEGLGKLLLGFAVSEVSLGKECAGEGIVRGIYDEAWPRDALTVVAVFSESSREEMAVMAKAAGFNDILLMDTYLLRILEEYYA